MKSRGAVVAILAFVLIATASAALTVRLTARAMEATAAEQAAEAPEIARLYIAKYGSLAAAAPAILKHVTRAGLHVTIFDAKTGTIYGSQGAHKFLGMHTQRFAGRFDGPDALPPPGTKAGLLAPVGSAGPPSVFEGPDNPAAHSGSATGSGPVSSSVRVWVQGGPHGPGGPGDGPRPSWPGIIIALVSGEMVHRATIPDGEITIFPDSESMLQVVRTVALVLGVVFVGSGTSLGLYVRGVRREALRPLRETTLALQRLAQRDFSPRTIVAGTGTAYDELARAYNAAVEAVSSAFAERRAAEIEMQRFIADAGHELRTPLTIVMGYLDIIEGGALANPNVANRITTGMRTEAARMRKLIEKLIILARMETPNDIDARSNIDVVSLVHRVIESLEPLVVQPIDVSGVPFAHVFANEDDLADALTNIIENGLKYAPLSSLAVSIDRTADCIVITVADRGPGMSTDEVRNAFERFYRGEKRGEITGSGLGLAIAKRAIERSRGTIRLHSVAGAGTTVTIELPEMPISVADSPATELARR